MQGHVTDEKGERVKAAIVRLYKISGDAERLEQSDETDAITYAETDEEGRFLIRDLDPEEKYYIEIHINHPAAEPAVVEEEPIVLDEEHIVLDEELDYDEDDRIEEKDIVDSLAAKTLTGSSTRETVCINCCCNYKATADLKSKPYLMKTNLW